LRLLKKLEEPDILKANKVVWTAEYVAAPIGSKPERWRHDQIVQRLRSETCEKCAYCEAIIEDVSYPHVEHILPKTRMPEQVYSWQNLTRACEVCNTKKGNYHNPIAPLLHPYDDDPSEHLDFHGPIVSWRLGSIAGERTVKRLDLSRPALVVERARRIQQLHDEISRWYGSDGEDRELLSLVIDRHLSDDSEFVASLRAHAHRLGYPVP
jgi:5-methylcytosine-specific restriction endonuclease McrA